MQGQWGVDDERIVVRCRIVGVKNSGKLFVFQKDNEQIGVVFYADTDSYERGVSASTGIVK